MYSFGGNDPDYRLQATTALTKPEDICLIILFPSTMVTYDLFQSRHWRASIVTLLG